MSPDKPTPILYEDEHLLIVDKPANLLTVPGRGPDKQDCLINRMIKTHPNARIIHRLDMATSGIVVIALSRLAQSSMSQLFAQREVSKSYIAVIAGKLSSPSGSIDYPLLCDWENRPKQKVDYEHGKSAQTDFSYLSYCQETDATRVKLKPLTGRSHQLRVHMMAIGHPILGDYFYAPSDILQKSPRLMLHAEQLSFIHPISQTCITTRSAVPF